jgi:hypothetical protein
MLRPDRAPSVLERAETQSGEKVCWSGWSPHCNVANVRSPVLALKRTVGRRWLGAILKEVGASSPVGLARRAAASSSRGVY